MTPIRASVLAAPLLLSGAAFAQPASKPTDPQIAHIADLAGPAGNLRGAVSRAARFLLSTAKQIRLPQAIHKPTLLRRRCAKQKRRETNA
jgi:predicted outer membrane protein